MEAGVGDLRRVFWDFVKNDTARSGSDAISPRAIACSAKRRDLAGSRSRYNLASNLKLENNMKYCCLVQTGRPLAI